MLTIIIFTNGRYTYVSALLKDLLETKLNIRYLIIDFKKKSKNQLRQDILKFRKKKKFTFLIEENNITFSQKFLKFIKRVRTKYVWFIGDDDRVETGYLKKLYSLLKNSKNSGFTLNHHSFEKNQEIIKNQNLEKRIFIEKLNIEKSVTEIGMLSTQIINTNKYKKIFKLLNRKILLNNGYPQVYIIMKLIEKFNDWKFISNKIVFYRYGNFNFKKKNLIERLNFELKGYFQPAKEIYGVNSKIYKNIFKKIFLSHVISWIAVALRKIARKDIIKLINKNIYLFPNFKYINFLLFIINKAPTKVSFYILKIIQKIYLLRF
jgi:hypothetical protein